MLKEEQDKVISEINKKHADFITNNDYLYLEVKNNLYIIKLETEFKNESGFYESAGYNYHTTRIPIITSKNKGISSRLSNTIIKTLERGRGFGTFGGHCYYINPTKLLKKLNNRTHVWTDLELKNGKRTL